MEEYQHTAGIFLFPLVKDNSDGDCTQIAKVFLCKLKPQKKGKEKREPVCLVRASTDGSVSRNNLIMKLFGAHSENLSTSTTLDEVF